MSPPRLSFWLLLATLTGCASASLELQDAHVRSGHTWGETPAPACELPRFSFEDARPHDQLGVREGKPLRYPGLTDWLLQLISTTTTVDESADRLEVELSRAYFKAHPTGHSFQLVLRARQAGTDDWRIYRGNIAGIIWFGTDDNYGHFVERAGAEAVRTMLTAEGRCSEPPADPTS